MRDEDRLSGDYCRPVSVLVLVYTLTGKVLLLRRRQPADIWQSVTGSLRRDESHADAAARELCEETGLADAGELRFSGKSRLFEIDPRWRHRFAPNVTQNVEFEWHYPLPAPLDVTLDGAEHSEFAWMTLEEAIDAVWSWTNRDALVELRDRL